MQKRILYIVLGTLFLFVAVAVFFLNSLWFMWGFIPKEQNIAFAARTSLFETQAGTLLQNFVLPRYGLNAIAGQSYRFAYSENNDQKVVVILPFFKHQRSISRDLIADGWFVQRIGLWIFAQKDTGDSIMLPQQSAMARAWRALSMQVRAIRESKLLYPAAVGYAEVGGLQGLSRSYKIIASFKDSQPVLSILTGDTWRRHIFADDIAAMEFSAARADMLLALPEKWFQEIPEETLHVLDERAYKELGLSFIKPEIMRTVSQFSEPVLAVAANSVAISVPDTNPNYREQVKSWFIKDDAHHFPERKAFALPDGTLAYELIPGSTPVVWNRESEECEFFNGQTSSAWLCNVQNRLVLASNKEAALNIHSSTDDLWYARFNADIVEQIRVLASIYSVEIIGNNTEALVKLKIQE